MIEWDFQKNIDEFVRNEFDIIDRREYKYEIIDHCNFVVWISKDDFEINENEIVHVKNYIFEIRINNDFTNFDIKGRIMISQNIFKIDIV